MMLRLSAALLRENVALLDITAHQGALLLTYAMQRLIGSYGGGALSGK